MNIHAKRSPKGWRLGRGYGVKRDYRTLRLSKYLATLPAPPTSIDHSSKISAPGMMGNDTFGDCVAAAAGHMVQEWTANAGTQKTISDSEVISAYLVLSPNDTGLYPIDWLNYWRKTQFGGDTIEGFVATDINLVQAKLSIQLFGSHFVGMSLPDTNTFGPWDVPNPTWAPDPFNGHMVCLVSYDDAKQQFTAISWGQFMPMSYGWFTKYVDECYAVLDDIELIKSSGLSPEGFDWTTLQNDIGNINDPVVTPPLPPSPPPAPPPDPGPVFPPVSNSTKIRLTRVEKSPFLVEIDGAIATQYGKHNDAVEAVEWAENALCDFPDSDVRFKGQIEYRVTWKN